MKEFSIVELAHYHKGFAHNDVSISKTKVKKSGKQRVQINIKNEVLKKAGIKPGDFADVIFYPDDLTFRIKKVDIGYKICSIPGQAHVSRVDIPIVKQLEFPTLKVSEVLEVKRIVKAENSVFIKYPKGSA